MLLSVEADSRTVYASATFQKAFFSEFQGAVTGQHEIGAGDVADDGVTFCVSAAALANAFRTTRGVTTAHMYLGHMNGGHYFVIAFAMDGFVRTHSIAYYDGEPPMRSQAWSECPNVLVAPPAVLTTLLSHLKGVDIATLLATDAYVQLQGLHTAQDERIAKKQADSSAPVPNVQTAVILERKYWTQIDVGPPVSEGGYGPAVTAEGLPLASGHAVANVSFPTKHFKHALAFAENSAVSVASPESAVYFSQPGNALFWRCCPSGSLPQTFCFELTLGTRWETAVPAAGSALAQLLGKVPAAPPAFAGAGMAGAAGEAAAAGEEGAGGRG